MARSIVRGITMLAIGLISISTAASSGGDVAASAVGGAASGFRSSTRAARPLPENPAAPLFGAPPAGVNPTTRYFSNATDICWGTLCSGNGSTQAISTFSVTGLPHSIWDVDLTTYIVHDWNSDLVLTVKSPAGTTISIARHRGQNGDDAYNGALFDDSATELVTDHVYGSGPFSPIVPEGALSRFIGENPNGTWTFTLDDSYDGEEWPPPYIDSWALDITTLDAALATSIVQDTNATVDAIPNPGSVSSMLTISGAGASMCDVNLTTVITHEWCGDLEISLTSPAGTTVQLSTGNGDDDDDVFNGMVWDDQAVFLATDGYTNGQVASPRVGEGKLSKFTGEDPNGVWTLTIADTSASHPSGNAGTLQSWSLEITSCVASKPGEGFCFGDGIDPIVTAQCPCGNFGAEAHGCRNSSFVNGALLTATGTTSPNTILFTMTGVPNNTLATGFRNSTLNAGGAVFGDGVRCQTGALLRFGTHNTGALGDAPNSWTAGADTVAPGITRYYLVQYRNSIPGFCPPETFNVSNGYKIVW